MLQLIWVLSCSSKMLNLSKLWLLLQCYCYSGQSQKLLLCSWASCWVASWKPWLVSKNLLLLPTFSKAYPTFLRVAEACYCCCTFWPTSIPHNTHLGDCLLHWRRCLSTYPSLPSCPLERSFPFSVFISILVLFSWETLKMMYGMSYRSRQTYLSFSVQHPMAKSPLYLTSFLLASLLPYISIGRENLVLDHFPLLLLSHLLLYSSGLLSWA